jgi:hypothetical protein
MRAITTDTRLIADVSEVLMWRHADAVLGRAAQLAAERNIASASAHQLMSQALHELRLQEVATSREKTSRHHCDWLAVRACLPHSLDTLEVRNAVAFSRWLGREAVIHALHVDLLLQVCFQDATTRWLARMQSDLMAAHAHAERRLRRGIDELNVWPSTASLHAIDLPHETWLTPVPACSTGVAGREWIRVLPTVRADASANSRG